MKKWKKILILALCLSLVQVPAVPAPGSIVAEAAGESGLQKEGGKYYYYSNGKKLTNKWKTVKETYDGQTIKYKYYFGNDGAAYMGKVSSGVMIPAIKKISGKYYGFDQLGHMLKGVYVKKGKFYMFDTATGVRDAAVTQKLRDAAKEGTKYSTLTRLLKSLGVKRVRKQTGLESCYGDGTDTIYSYPGFDVQMFKNGKTKKTTIVSVVATGTQGAGAVTGTENEEGSTDNVENPLTQTGAGLRKIDGKYYYYKKSGKLLKNSWKTIGGYKYYFTADGSAQTYSAKINGKLYLFDLKGRLAKGTGNRFKTVGNNRYYVSAGGKPYTGYMVINKSLYYANSKGVLKRNATSARGYVYDDKGKAKNNAAANLKITTMQIAASITNSKMTKEQKLKACWDYVVAGKRFTYYSRFPNLTVAGWQKQEALDMLNTRAGNCYGFACAFAALACEVGYTPYVIAGRVASNGRSRDNVGDGMTPHCWVRIDGKYYDPEAEFKGWWKGVYGLSSYDGIKNTVQYIVKFNKV